jgi:hypothetical protein
VVYGLVHQEQLADVVVEFTLGQTGFDRYNKLLAGLFEKLAGIDIANVRRQSSTKTLLEEATDLQKVRNRVIHQGLVMPDAGARHAIPVASDVFTQILEKMLTALGQHFDRSHRVVHGAEL